MTRDELVDKVDDILLGWDGDPCERLDTAIEVLNTIFDALKEPTEEMSFAGGEYVLSVGSIDCMHVDDRPEFGMKGRETGSYELFQAMLSASPLAPEEKK